AGHGSGLHRGAGPGAEPHDGRRHRRVRALGQRTVAPPPGQEPAGGTASSDRGPRGVAAPRIYGGWMLEEERKYLVDDGFTMPDLSAAGRVAAKQPVTLKATYYDTGDRLLARSGISLRYRKGDAAGKAWTVKLPSTVEGVRHEHSRPAAGNGVVPADLLDLVTAARRGAELAPSAVLRTVRTAYDIVDR